MTGGKKQWVEYQEIRAKFEVLIFWPENLLSGTCLAVEFILDLLAEGWSEARDIAELPQIGS
jgi:hypothetical protein